MTDVYRPKFPGDHPALGNSATDPYGPNFRPGYQPEEFSESFKSRLLRAKSSGRAAETPGATVYHVVSRTHSTSAEVAAGLTQLQRGVPNGFRAERIADPLGKDVEALRIIANPWAPLPRPAIWTNEDAARQVTELINGTVEYANGGSSDHLLDRLKSKSFILMGQTARHVTQTHEGTGLVGYVMNRDPDEFDPLQRVVIDNEPAFSGYADASSLPISGLYVPGHPIDRLLYGQLGGEGDVVWWADKDEAALWFNRTKKAFEKLNNVFTEALKLGFHAFPVEELAQDRDTGIHL